MILLSDSERGRLLVEDNNQNQLKLVALSLLNQAEQERCPFSTFSFGRRKI